MNYFYFNHYQLHSIWCCLFLRCWNISQISRFLETVVDADCVFLLTWACGMTTVGGNVMVKLNRFPTTLPSVGSVQSWFCVLIITWHSISSPPCIKEKRISEMFCYSRNFFRQVSNNFSHCLFSQSIEGISRLVTTNELFDILLQQQ